MTVTGIDPSSMKEDEKVRFVLKKIKAGDQTLAAMTDPDKEREEEGGRWTLKAQDPWLACRQR